jgi:hypothetical protein
VPDNYLNNAIAACIVATSDRNAHAAHQHFQRLARLFNCTPERITSIYRQPIVYAYKSAAAFDYCYNAIVPLFRMRNRLFHDAQYFHYTHDEIDC